MCREQQNNLHDIFNASHIILGSLSSSCYAVWICHNITIAATVEVLQISLSLQQFSLLIKYQKLLSHEYWLDWIS